MIYIVILLVILLSSVSFRHLYLKREINRTTKILSSINRDETNKKVNIHLYDKNLERLTEEINNHIDKRKHSLAMKKQSENMMKQSISYISHDLRTPLTSINGYIQLLESKDLSDEDKEEYLKIIRDSSLRLNILLEDFYELSLIDQDEYPLAREQVDIKEVILEVLFSFYNEFEQRGITPDIDMPETSTYLYTDPSTLKRVIENLIINSIRHSTGDIDIHLTVTASVIQFNIKNPAKKLSEEDIIHMFDPFYKADQTRKGEGTGLGLPITKSLMEKMEGTIQAEPLEDDLKIICQWPIK
ncbi:sensor histidine kinase KdpD [Salinicoccus sp. YB14-2]|uniref:sensor histidine kinase n=1 Tax=Salinicoccus sp. YB14-2 TaxID=1572701 RepID=UPI00068D9024|nr:HAMP domain-containing sensor histidine kinase [Salinicoccus sp. YB14-2]